MKNFTLSLIGIFVSVLVIGQNKEQLIGHWEFVEIADKANADEKSIQMVQMFFGEMTFDFASEGRYKMAGMMGKSETGTWKLEHEALLLMSDEGNGNKLEILDLNDSLLTIKVRSSGFVMRKTSKEAVVQAAETTVLTYDTASADQLMGKWMLQKKDGHTASEEAKEFVNAIIKDSYIDFKANGKCEIFILGVKEKGTWKLNEEGSGVVIAYGNSEVTRLWHFIKITSSELVMTQGGDAEKWFFSAE
jgi:hypothetical protein